MGVVRVLYVCVSVMRCGCGQNNVCVYVVRCGQNTVCMYVCVYVVSVMRCGCGQDTVCVYVVSITKVCVVSVMRCGQNTCSEVWVWSEYCM